MRECLSQTDFRSKTLESLVDKLNPTFVRDAMTGERKAYVRYETVVAVANFLIENEPEIIHCRECQHNRRPEGSPNVDCALYYEMSDPCGYCHKAERKK